MACLIRDLGDLTGERQLVVLVERDDGRDALAPRHAVGVREVLGEGAGALGVLALFVAVEGGLKKVGGKGGWREKKMKKREEKKVRVRELETEAEEVEKEEAGQKIPSQRISAPKFLRTKKSARLKPVRSDWLSEEDAHGLTLGSSKASSKKKAAFGRKGR